MPGPHYNYDVAYFTKNTFNTQRAQKWVVVLTFNSDQTMYKDNFFLYFQVLNT
jgi:hypothetical protein